MSWKDIVKTVAPVIGTALGGPMAGGAVKMLAGSLLGDENAPEEAVQQFILDANPDALLKLKTLDKEYDIKMQKLGVDVFKLEVEDRKSAREAHKDSKFPAMLCIALTAMVTLMFVLLSLHEVPEKNSSILYMMIGQVVTAWGGAIAYWFGTTKSSSDKNKILKTRK